MSGGEPALRRSPMPVREPVAAVSVVPARARTATALGAVTQGTLALALPWEAPPAIGFGSSAGSVAARGIHDHGRNRRAGRVPGTVTGAHVTPVLPEAREWAARFAKAAMEVAMGQRPHTQLIRWTSPEVQEALARRGSLVSRMTRRTPQPVTKPKLRALQLCSPVAQAFEVAAVMADNEKVRAIAFRMEGFKGRWRVTAFELG